MTRYEKMIVSAYTGVLMVDFKDFHEWVEDYLGYPVWSAEMATEEFWGRLKEIVKNEFVRICSE